MWYWRDARKSPMWSVALKNKQKETENGDGSLWKKHRGTCSELCMVGPPSSARVTPFLMGDGIWMEETQNWVGSLCTIGGETFQLDFRILPASALCRIRWCHRCCDIIGWQHYNYDLWQLNFQQCTNPLCIAIFANSFKNDELYEFDFIWYVNYHLRQLPLQFINYLQEILIGYTCIWSNVFIILKIRLFTLFWWRSADESYEP